MGHTGFLFGAGLDGTCMQDVIDACNAGKEVRISTVANTYPNYCIKKMIKEAGVDIRFFLS